MDNSPEDDNRSAAQTGTTNYEHTGGSSTQQQQQNQQQRNAPRREVKKEDSQSVTGSHSSPSSSGRNKQTQSTSAQHATSDYRTNAWVTPKPEPDEDVEMQYLHGDHNRYQNQIPQGTQAFSHTTPHSQFHSRSPVERSPPMREYENRGAWSPHHSPGWSQHSSSCSQPRGFRTRGSIDFGVPSNTPTPELLSPGPTYSSGGSSYLPSASSDTSSTMNTPDRKPLNTSLGRSGERRDWGVPSKPFDRGYGTVEAKLMEFGNEERRGRSVWRNIGSSNRFGDWISQEGLPSNQRADVFDAGPNNMPRVQEAVKRRSAPAASNSAVVGDVHVQHKYTFSLPYGASLPPRTDRSGHGGGIVESPEDGVMTQEYYQQWCVVCDCRTSMLY